MYVESWELWVCGVFLFFFVCGGPLLQLLFLLYERRQDKRKRLIAVRSQKEASERGLAEGKAWKPPISS